MKSSTASLIGTVVDKSHAKHPAQVLTPYPKGTVMYERYFKSEEEPETQSIQEEVEIEEENKVISIADVFYRIFHRER
jgi:hypothetical protein